MARPRTLSPDISTMTGLPRSRFTVRPGVSRVLLLVAAATAACGDPPRAAQPAELRIGILPVLTGPRAATSGAPMMEGARLAVDEANQAGGLVVDGRRLRVTLLAHDTRDTEQGAVSATRSLLNDRRIIAVIGPQTSIHAIRVAAVTEPAGVLMITPTATHPSVTAGRRYAFRVALTGRVQALVLARFAVSELRARRLGMLYDVADPYNRDMAERIGASFQGLGGEVVANEAYTTDQARDYRPQLRRIVESGAEVLVLPNYTADARVQLRQAREVGFRGVILGTDSWENAAGIESEPAAEGAYFPPKWVPASGDSATRPFRERYRAAYGHDPAMPAAYSYDAVGLVLAAVRARGTTDSDALRDYLAGLRGYPGVTGWISYAGTGDPIKGMVISRVRGGHAEVFWSLQPPALEALLARIPAQPPAAAETRRPHAGGGAP
jgi:branched-chain amino acid transport system substrate-binding protein